MYFYMSLQKRFRDVSLERRPGERKKYVYIQMDLCYFLILNCLQILLYIQQK